MYPLQPTLNRIVVRPDPEITKVGSIFIPDCAKVEEYADGDKYQTGQFLVTTGTVLAAGPGRLVKKGEWFDDRPCKKDFFRKMELKAGDRIQFKRVGDGRAGVEVEIAGETVLVMREDDVIGKVTA